MRSINDRIYLLSFDAEANGLWGTAFSVAGAVFNFDGEIRDSIILRCPIEGNIDPFVEEHFLPQMEEIEINCSSYQQMLERYFEWRKEWRAVAIDLVHMGVPIEARLFLDAHDMGIIEDWEGPHPLIDVSTIAEIWDSCDRYNILNGVHVGTIKKHNPLYNSIAAAKAYLHWLRNK